jgi:hypothetical protein
VEHASDLIEYLRRHFKNPLKHHIRGRVGAVHRSESELVEFLLSQGEAKPLQGVKVWTFAGGKIFSAITDARGRFELAVPGAGSYSVQADLAPYHSGKALIDVPRGGACAVKDFGLLSNSSISGRVWDGRGQPLQHTVVGLVDLDRSPSVESTRAWFRTAYPEQQDGIFLFENVPLGRYLLAFNPDGPQADGYQPFPLESTFYPNGSSRAQAQTIEINTAGVRLVGKDMIVGPPVAFRAVTVKVRFSDGSPMATAIVDITGEPLEPGRIPWHALKHIQKGQSGAGFHVPANRKFRISVRDWYGRDLKKTYESTHVPGSTAVIQEFVVVP